MKLNRTTNVQHHFLVLSLFIKHSILNKMLEDTVETQTKSRLTDHYGLGKSTACNSH